jgi:hypothetical protein
MFDIVSKNKKLSFLVSFINDNVSPQHTFSKLLTIQKNSLFIQKKIKHIKKNIINKRLDIRSIHTRVQKKDTNMPQKRIEQANNIVDIGSTEQNTKDKNDGVIPYSKLYTSTNKTIILDGMTHPEYIVYAFLICVDSNFIHTQDRLKKDFMDTLKYKLAVELDTKNLYKEFKYNKIRSLKKTILQNALFNNKDIQYIHLYRYLGDYFNVNFIGIIDDIFVQYFNDYKQDRLHIVLTQNKDIVHIDTSLYDDDLIYVKEFNQDNYILFPGQTVKAYTKLKVTEIRKIAEKKNINLYISGLKKKTKKMLIEEILQL